MDIFGGATFSPSQTRQSEDKAFILLVRRGRMHETVIAKNIITEAEKHGAVSAIDMEIGELAHVPGQELIECLEGLKPDWKITWKERPAKVACACGFEGHPKVLARGHDHFMIECPECGETPELTDGTQITILKVRVD